MSSKRKIAWADVDGAFDKKRRLHFVEAEDKTFLCPVSHCEHASFSSKRDAGRMFQSIMGGIITSMSLHRKQTPGSNVTTKSVTMKLPGMLENNTFENEFLNWMSSPAGGGRGKNHAEQIVSRILKSLLFASNIWGQKKNWKTIMLIIA